MLEDRSFFTFTDDSSSTSVVEDYAAAIVANVSDAIFLLDTDGRIVDSNRKAAQLLRIDQAKLVGEFVDNFVVDGIDKAKTPKSNHVERLIDNIRTGVFSEIEAVLVHGGNMTPVFVSFGVIEDARGEPQFIIMSAKDISRMKALERDLRQQEMVAISRDRLRSLAELSVGLIHELGQPLSSLRLSVGIAQRMIDCGNAGGERMREKLRDMTQLINRMATTIHNIRTFARQSKDYSLGLVRVDGSIENALSLVSHELKDRGIRVVVRKGENVPPVRANSVMLEQVLINLLTNARDAFGRGRGLGSGTNGHDRTILISLSLEENRWVQVTVEDSAGGIEKKIRDRIFEPFFTTKKEGEGTGLGLAIAHGIVTKLGGQIQLEVEDGVGSIFRVRIPVARGAEAEGFAERMHVTGGREIGDGLFPVDLPVTAQM